MSMVQVVLHLEYQEQYASDASHDAKGLKLAKGKIGSPDVEVLLKWNKVAERVRQLFAQMIICHRKKWKSTKNDRNKHWQISADVRRTAGAGYFDSGRYN